VSAKHENKFSTTAAGLVSASILLLVLMICLDAFGTQERDFIISSPPHPIIDMFFLDAKRGWATIESDGSNYDTISVLMTTDGGNTWKELCDHQRGFGRLFFLDSLHGWVLANERNDNNRYRADDMVVSSTQDGGKTWTRLAKVGEQYTFPRLLPSATGDILFVDGSHGWATGLESREFVETHDGGKSFSRVSYGGKDGQYPGEVLADPEKKNFVVIGNDVFLASNENGSTWRSLLSKREGVTAAWLFPQGHWLAFGAGGRISSTLDYGANWKDVAPYQSGSHDVYGVSFYDSNHGCAVGDPGILLCTSDAGETWVNRDTLPKSVGNGSPLENTFSKIILLPSGMGWVLSGFGRLYQTLDAGKSWNEVDLFNISSERVTHP
jgi:photosystem II stability/assembly factor-like uncharacterized protein